jgi:hypothetical protein
MDQLYGKTVLGGAGTRLSLVESRNTFYCALFRLVTFENAGQ